MGGRPRLGGPRGPPAVEGRVGVVSGLCVGVSWAGRGRGVEVGGGEEAARWVCGPRRRDPVAGSRPGLFGVRRSVCAGPAGRLPFSWVVPRVLVDSPVLGVVFTGVWGRVRPGLGPLCGPMFAPLLPGVQRWLEVAAWTSARAAAGVATRGSGRSARALHAGRAGEPAGAVTACRTHRRLFRLTGPACCSHPLVVW